MFFFFTQANALGITGDMKGNGLQAGGTFAVDQTGKTLFDHRQLRVADHPKISDILASLGITATATGSISLIIFTPYTVLDKNICFSHKLYSPFAIFI